MATYGGKREGAGRKKASHTILAEEMRKKLVEEVNKKLPELLEAKFDLALGHQVLEIDKEGEERVYTKSPDGNTLRYLLDQVIGKAKENVEFTNPQENDQLREINEKLKGMFVDVKSRKTKTKNS